MVVKKTKKTVAKKTKKVVKKATKSPVVKKKSKSVVKKTEKKLTKKELELQAVVEHAKKEKDLFSQVPTPYRRKIRDVLQKCKERGYVTSEVLTQNINLENCENQKDVWKCIYNIFEHHCIDVLKRRTNNLLKEINEDTDDEFPRESQPTAYDTVQVYFREMAQYKLLTAKEEQELGKKIAARRDILEKKTRITNQKKKNEILKEGLIARDALATANLRLVVNIAKNYTKGSKGPHTLLDLVQEGTKGLYTAVDKFDYKTGYKFSTYATHWVKQSIIRALANDGRTIRVPVHMSDTISRYKRLIVRLEQDLGRAPTAQEIAAEMGITLDKVNLIRRLEHDVEQLDKPYSESKGESEGTTIADITPDESEDDPDVATSRDILSKQIKDILNELSPKEKRIIELRHGMVDGVQYTLEQIGKKENVTRERIRQIEAKAIEKLRSAENIKRLRNY